MVPLDAAILEADSCEGESPDQKILKKALFLVFFQLSLLIAPAVAAENPPSYAGDPFWYAVAHEHEVQKVDLTLAREGVTDLFASEDGSWFRAKQHLRIFRASHEAVARMNLKLIESRCSTAIQCVQRLLLRAPFEYGCCEGPGGSGEFLISSAGTRSTRSIPDIVDLLREIQIGGDEAIIHLTGFETDPYAVSTISMKVRLHVNDSAAPLFSTNLRGDQNW